MTGVGAPELLARSNVVVFVIATLAAWYGSKWWYGGIQSVKQPVVVLHPPKVETPVTTEGRMEIIQRTVGAMSMCRYHFGTCQPRFEWIERRGLDGVWIEDFVVKYKTQ